MVFTARESGREEARPQNILCRAKRLTPPRDPAYIPPRQWVLICLRYGNTVRPRGTAYHPPGVLVATVERFIFFFGFIS